jgi:hypothetical protein
MRLLTALSWPLPALALIGPAGCGGSRGDAGADAGSCDMLDACGGDVVGSWSVQSLCFANAEVLFAAALDEPMCEGAIKSSQVHASGTYVYGKDGSASADVVYSIEFGTLWSAACLSALAGQSVTPDAAQCAGLQQQYENLPEIDSAPCRLQGNACACSISTGENVTTTPGSYSVKGNTLQQGDDNSPYCVQGDTLTILRTSGGLTGTLVLKRK